MGGPIPTVKLYDCNLHRLGVLYYIWWRGRMLRYKVGNIKIKYYRLVKYIVGEKRLDKISLDVDK